MKPQSSPLNIVDFAILNFELNFIAPQANQDFDYQRDFKSYELDIDFDINNDDFFQVFIKADINRGELKAPGYSIFAEAACIFQINNDRLNDEQKNSLKDFSTIYIALNSLRGLISSFTANAPFGRYILPSIDLNDLINKKKASIKQSSQKKGTTSKSPDKKVSKQKRSPK